jgi:hypothetical protein
MIQATTSLTRADLFASHSFHFYLLDRVTTHCTATPVDERRACPAQLRSSPIAPCTDGLVHLHVDGSSRKRGYALVPLETSIKCRSRARTYYGDWRRFFLPLSLFAFLVAVL